MLSKTVFVKDISNLSEARYCSGMMVDYISFELSESDENAITLEKCKEIINWLSGVKTIVSIKNAAIADFENILKLDIFDGIFFHENQIDFVDQLNCEIKLLEINTFNISIPDSVNFIIVNDEALIKNYSKSNKILLGYDFENIQRSNLDINGFAFVGSKEINPGINNYESLMQSLEALDS